MGVCYTDRLTGAILATPSAAAQPLGLCVVEGDVIMNGVPVATPAFVVPARDGTTWVIRSGHVVHRGESPCALHAAGETLDGDALHRDLLATEGLWHGAEAWDEIVAEAPLSPTLNDLISHGWLEEVLRDPTGPLPHLTCVCHEPREELDYEAVRVPVGRARRLAPTALRHLAAHSEDWAYSDGSSVQPNHVLSSLPYEDLDTYENRVAVEAAVGLGNAVKRRIQEVEEAREQRARWQTLLDGEGGAHAVLRRVGSLISRSEVFRNHSLGDTEAVERRVERILTELRRYRRNLQRLQRSRLLTLPKARGGVDPRATVGPRLRMTNLLREHPHYRPVADLWRDVRRHAGNARTEAEDHARSQELCRTYDAFCLAVVVHALDNLGFKFMSGGGPSDVAAGGSARFEGRRGVVTLTASIQTGIEVRDGGSVLRFVPSPSVLDQDTVDALLAGEERVRDAVTAVVCLAHPGEGLLEPTSWYPRPALHGGRVVVAASPSNEFSVEAVARVIQAWFSVRRWAQYPFAVTDVPRVVSAHGLPAWAAAVGRDAVEVTRPFCASEREAFLDAVAAALPGAREAVEADLSAATQAFEQITTCPTCDTPGAAFLARDRRTFWCTCARGTSCSEWGLRVTSWGQRYAVLIPRDAFTQPEACMARGYLGRDLVTPPDLQGERILFPPPFPSRPNRGPGHLG